MPRSSTAAPMHRAQPETPNPSTHKADGCRPPLPCQSVFRSSFFVTLLLYVAAAAEDKPRTTMSVPFATWSLTCPSTATPSVNGKQPRCRRRRTETPPISGLWNILSIADRANLQCYFDAIVDGGDEGIMLRRIESRHRGGTATICSSTNLSPTPRGSRYRASSRQRQISKNARFITSANTNGNHF